MTILQHIKSRVAPFALAITAIGLLANLLLVASYVMELREQQVLVSEIEATRQSLAEYSRPATFQRLLAENKMTLAAEEQAFPNRISGSQVTRELHNLARSRGLAIVELGTEPGETRAVGQHTYTELLVGVQVSGSLEALQAFLRALEEGTLPGVRIDEVNISQIASLGTGVPLEHPGSHSTDGYSQELAASLAISVYQRQGNVD